MLRRLCAALLIAAPALAPLPASAQGLVAPGTKITVAVEYEYVSGGERKDKYDQNIWNIRRFAAVTATLSAQPAQPLPAIHKMEESQTKDLAAKQAAAASAATTMQPMMNDMMALMEKCGEDEACLEREVMSYGFGNSDEINATREKAAPDFATVSKQGAPRYQMWVPTGRQTGNYEIVEKMNYVDADPICRSHADQRCRTQVTRSGRGDIPLPPGMKPSDSQAAGTAMAEFDSVKGTLILTLPAPMNALPFNETVESDDPETETGTEAKVIYMPPMKEAAKTLTIPVKGAMAGQSGMEKIAIKGSSGGDATLNPSAGEDGTLTIRWTISKG